MENYESALAELSDNRQEYLEKNAFYEGLAGTSSEELRAQCEGDPGLSELAEEMLTYCVRYFSDVTAQQEIIESGIEDVERMREVDMARSRLHDAMIDSVRILARNMRERGKDVSWAATLDKKGRVGYAVFALSLVITDWNRLKKELL